MKNLQMPHSYAPLSEAEQVRISGGGPLRDALDEFFNNIRVDDLFWGGGLISFSFSFVPMLLFKVVKTGLNVALELYDRFSNQFNFSKEGTDMIQYLAATSKQETEDPSVL